MYFQALDDKTSCVGIYYDGNLIFDESDFPSDLTGMKTWKYSGSIKEDVEFAWIYANGTRSKKQCSLKLIFAMSKAFLNAISLD